MTVNRIQIKTSNVDKVITIPFATDFDESLGREQLVNLYERAEMQDNVNITQDFETIRYSPDTTNIDKHIFYDIQFNMCGTTNGSTTDYMPDYFAAGITHKDVVERKSNFIKSFFFFFFYDTPNPQTQRLYFSVVNPINNGKPFVKGGPYDWNLQITNNPLNINYDNISYVEAELEDLNTTSPTGPPYYYDKLESSMFEFSSVGKLSENYYINWLKNRDLVPYNVFYMSCKFFNAETGKIHKFINKVQPANTFNLNTPDYYYYQMILDPIKFTYVFNEFDLTTYNSNNGIGPQVGSSMNTAIKFYEYVNP